MIDVNKHKFYMVQILKEIYSDRELANYLAFKGGTALMFFYELPRFSVDLDFNLLAPEKSAVVYRKVRTLLLKYGKIDDEAQKFYGNIFVLDYGVNERKLKIEISNRQYGDEYEIKNLLGITIKVMKVGDMFAHKLCALLDRNALANRDIFDCWFFMQKRVPVNRQIIENRMSKPYSDYLQDCIDTIEKMPDRSLLNGLVNQELKTFVRNKLRSETVTLLRIYKEFPIFLP